MVLQGHVLPFPNSPIIEPNNINNIGSKKSQYLNFDKLSKDTLFNPMPDPQTGNMWIPEIHHR